MWSTYRTITQNQNYRDGSMYRLPKGVTQNRPYINKFEFKF